MQFQVLGSLRVWTGASWSVVPANQQRVVMALLVIDAGQVVSTDRLVTEVWGSSPPRSAVSTIQGYVMRLRRLASGAGAGAILTRSNGYELDLGDDDLDRLAFERLAASGRRFLAEGRLEHAAADLSRALSFWRGPALADVPETPAVAAERARLEHGRLSALERLFTAEMSRDRHREVLDDLFWAVRQHPFNEQLRAQLMTALHRCGRRAEALEAYRQGRAVLKAELGLEPGSMLRDLHQAFLTG